MANEVVGVADNIVGASLPQDTTDYKAMLAGFGEDKIVTVYNPLTSDFRFQHARTTTQAAPLTKEQQFAEEKAGLSMRKEANSVAHYAQFWILKAGESKNLPGDIAQKAVQDLVTYILMQRAGKGKPKNVADGYARAQVEKEIVVAVHDNVTFFNSMKPEEYSQKQVEKLNESTDKESPVEPPDPPPGQGVSFTNEPDRKSPTTSTKA